MAVQSEVVAGAPASDTTLTTTNSNTTTTSGTAVYHRAEVADVLRANEKDIFFIDELKKRINELLVEFDSQRAYQLESKVNLLCKLSYTAISLFLGGRTLGEEYVSIQPSVLTNNGSVLAQASKLRLTLYICLCMAPLWIKKVSESHKKLWNSLQLYLLYRTGQAHYHSLSHWLSGLRYFYNGLDLHPKSARFTDYRSLCSIHLIIVLTLLLKQLHSFVLDRLSKQNVINESNETNSNGNGSGGVLAVLSGQTESSSMMATKKECFVCLNRCDKPTVTECGHIFCWDCISDWCSSNHECPLCRNHILPQKLVCLLNI